MAAEPVWQSNYADLSDDRNVRFGAECAVCHARYVTTPVLLVAPLPVEGEPDTATARAVDEQKYRLFTDFDKAFRSITITCFRCGQAACPDCWDVDKQMCGACLAERGLIRSPSRGEPVEGPLADGFLRRAEPGRYADIGRPAWLKELLRSQSDPESPRMASTPAPASPPSGQSTYAMNASPDRHAALAEMSFPVAPPLPLDAMSFAPVPAAKIESPAGGPLGATPAPATRSDRLNGPEGVATSAMVECPRCHTVNHDFVTQCGGCGLQLIQVCPNCEKLNPGHAEECQYCRATLRRPRGWSGVNHPIVALDPLEARRRITAGPGAASAMPRTPPPNRPAPQAVPVAGPSAWTDKAQVNSRPAPRRQSPPTPVAARGAPVAAGPYPGIPLTAQHPYETGAPALAPVMDYGADSQHYRQGSRFMAAVGPLIERVFTIVLLVGIFAVVGLAAAAEASPQANQLLALYLHFDIKSHVDQLLSQLHIHLHN
jgi:hypothetical protein